MGLFSKILEKLGVKKNNASAGAASAPAKSASAGAGMKAMPRAKDDVANAPKAAPKAVAVVDVVAHLESLAKSNPAQLNWKTSIVDLLKLLDLDSSGEARKEMAVELGCPEDMMHDSAKMNTWLHKTVLKKIAENGGNIPQELLD